MIYFLIITFIFSCQQKNYLFEKDDIFSLKNSYFEVHISKKTGSIISIISSNREILNNDCIVDISSQSKDAHEDKGITMAEDHYSNFAEVYFKREYSDKSIEYRFIIDSLTLAWEIEILSKKDIEQEVDVRFNIPIINAMNHIFHPGGNAPFRVEDIGEKNFIYRKNIFVPIITGYNSKEDYGLSIVVPFEIPKPGLSFSLNKEELTVLFYHLRLSNKRKTKVVIYLVPHEGGWRPGLNFLLNKYPEYFYPAVENSKIGEGWYYLGNPFDNKNKIMQVKNHGVKWIELHGHFPFYGLYAPEQKDWGIIMNSDKISLNNWEKVIGKKSNSYKNMQNLINLWHKYDIQIYLYFQSFEAWHQYAEKYFPEDIARDRNGDPLRSWKFTNLMNPNPASKWGKYIVDQAKKLLIKYPEMDGIFYDRMDYWNYDFAHDDGITMIDGKSAYMLGLAQEKINETIFDFFHKNKKGIWGNGPTSIEVCKNLDGIMAEGNLRNLYKTQYLGLARPIVYYPYDRILKQTEEKLKNAILCGAFPSVTLGGIECQKLDKKYQPLFELMRGRKWVLSKNPVIIPDQLTGNIFQTSEGDYVVIIVSSEKSQLPPHPFEYNIPITINLPDINKINFAYLLSGDWTGVNSVNFKVEDKSIVINLPYHLSSSLIYLTKLKKHDLVRLSSPVLIKGKNEILIFHVDNFDSKNPTAVEVETPWFKETKKLIANVVKFYTTVPNNTEGEVDIKIRYNGKNHKMSCWITDPISIVPKEKIFVQSVGGDDVLFYITNNLNEKIMVNLKSEFTQGNGKIDLPHKFILRPYERKEINVSITAKTEGELKITLSTDKYIIVKLFPLKMSLIPEKDDLFFENFQNDMKKWTIDGGEWHVLNGTAMGSGSRQFAFIKNNDWINYVFEAKIRCKGSDNPAVDWLKSYIFFRLQDRENFYRFGIHGDAGVIDLYKYVKGKWTRLGTSLFKPEKNKWYALKIQVKGTKIAGYINGEIVIEASDNTFPTGGIGIGVLEDAMRCDYKDVVVKEY